MKAFSQIKYGVYKEAESSVTLRSSGGDVGGGGEVLVVEPICFVDDITIKIDGGGGTAFSVRSRDYKGAQCVVQNVTGTLNPGAHPGSYNGQDAYNDMLVVNENNNNKSQLHAHGRDNGRDGECAMRDRLQRSSDCNRYRGG